MVLARADLAAVDATSQADLVHRGELTALELVDAGIGRVERLNPGLNAVVSTCFERARDRARAGLCGPFAGVPYLLEDLIVEEEGLPFTEGSVWLRGHVSGFTSTLVTRLRAAGLVVVAGPTPRSSGWPRPVSRCCTAPRATRGTSPGRRAGRREGRRRCFESP